MLFIGIDPGQSGGLAGIDELGLVVTTLKMPETEQDLLNALRDFREHANHGYVRAVLERVSAGVFGANRRMGVTSAFTFGRGVGALRMALTAAEIPFDEVAPVKWQTAMMCRTRGDKNISKRRAQQLFPQVKVTHAIADCLLLAEYCRREERVRRGAA